MSEGNSAAGRITVHQGEKPVYDIVFRRDFGGLEEELRKLGVQGRKVCIVTDSRVASYYLEQVSGVISGCAGTVTSFVFPEGEENKNLDVVRKLYEHLILQHFERKDLLVALGGGVTGDLTGFAAATYLRGIDFIQVPTTLLSQVDSSIGGKTGVDFDSYKNMVGAFYMPRLVYMNLSVLATLTERHYLEGMGEIIKHGLIRDRAYFYWLRDHMEDIRRRDLETCGQMIRRSCEIKREVVERDPKEQGERALLNFGHTLGHAIEKEMGFALLHGECVALGCIAAAFISMKRGWISRQDYEDVRNVTAAAGLPAALAGADCGKILEAVRHDKKMEAGVVKFILLRQIGEACIDRTVSREEMAEGLAEILGAAPKNGQSGNQQAERPEE